MSVSETELSTDELDDFPMLKGVGLAERRELLEFAELRRLNKGQVLIEQGKSSGCVYFVLDGILGIHLDSPQSEAVAVVGHGETVGELSLLDGSGASAYVVADSDVRLVFVKEDDFWSLVNDSHAFAVNLLVKLAERLRANNETVSQNVQKRRQYERAAMFDGLTGIHNRRWLDDSLHRLVRRHEGGSGPLSVSLIDVDRFKQFNDSYGHAAGDHVLTVVAGTLASNLRPTDLVARFGGEEFVILFPDTDADEAFHAAERVREAVSRTDLTMPDGTELPHVTISMGISELQAGQSPAELLKVADAAMYRAKQAGRNQVKIGAPDEIES